MQHAFPLSAFPLLALGMGLLGCQSQTSTAPRAAGPLPVQVIEFGQEQGSHRLDFSGTLQENRSTPISFQVSGRVLAIAVDEGDTLAAGQWIATVDSSSLQESFLLAQAKLRQAQDAYDRLKTMHAGGSVSEVKWVEMETGLAQAQAMANIARKNREDARLYAPVAGIVVGKNIEVGQLAMPGITVLKLVDARYLDAVFSVPETEVLHVKEGLTVRISLPGAGNDTLVGKISEVAVQAHPVSRSFPVRVRLDNRAGALRMGMACHGELVLPGDSAAVLPVQAVLEKPNGTRYVYVVEKGKAMERPVQLGGFLGKGLRVLAGLEKGDKVVVEGMHGVSQGLNVQF